MSNKMQVEKNIPEKKKTIKNQIFWTISKRKSKNISLEN